MQIFLLGKTGLHVPFFDWVLIDSVCSMSGILLAYDVRGGMLPHLVR